MIYDKQFVEFLNEYLSPVRETTTEFICRCPYCEDGLDKDHYHLYISKDIPVWNCFHCVEKGHIKKLIKDVKGESFTNYYDENKLKRDTSDKKEIKKTLYVPDLIENSFKLKSKYILDRFRNSVKLSDIPGMIFDVFAFFNKNNIIPKSQNLLNYLHQNFVGFICKNKSVVMFRNIDKKEKDFKHYKLKLSDAGARDYYELTGLGGPSSKKIIISEGIFDILSEYFFDFTNNKTQTRIYGAALSSSFENTLKDICLYNNIFKTDVVILSDSDIDVSNYRKIMNKNKHFINTMKIYYNNTGKDFNDFPVNAFSIKIY